MSLKSESVLSLEVPVVVYLAERSMTTAEVMRLMPGSIIEMSKQADEDLDLYINNHAIGTGVAVKVGENFGLKISCIGTPEECLAAAIESAAQRRADEEAA